jgi:hypothetical protein
VTDSNSKLRCFPIQVWRELVSTRKEAAEKLSAVAITRRFAVEVPAITGLMQRCPKTCGNNLDNATKAAAFAALFIHAQVPDSILQFLPIPLVVDI